MEANNNHGTTDKPTSSLGGAEHEHEQKQNPKQKQKQKQKLRIKSSSSRVSDAEVELPGEVSTSVGQLKALVRKALRLHPTQEEPTPTPAHTRTVTLTGAGAGAGAETESSAFHLRLICKGRLLSPDESPLSEFGVLENDVVHAVVARAAVSRDESNPDLRRRRLLVEEEWMRVQGPASEFRLNLAPSALASLDVGTREAGGPANVRGRAGTDPDFVWGFCLGFAMGILGLVWVWMPTVPHKRKIGILAGICFQIILEGSDDPVSVEDYQGEYDYNYNLVGEPHGSPLFDSYEGQLRGSRLRGAYDGD
eukprot:jgi/Psemu1/289385/fgenesh1_pg.352_\